MNKLITIGVVGIAAYGIFSVLRMKNVADEMQASIANPRIHKIDWSGLVLKVDALISNPTKDSMSITKPVVTLTSNGKTVATTKPENALVQIKPLAQSKIEGIELNVGWTTLIPFISGIIGKIPTIINSIKNKTLSIGKLLDIPLEMTISTYADNLFIKSTPTKLN